MARPRLTVPGSGALTPPTRLLRGARLRGDRSIDLRPALLAALLVGVIALGGWAYERARQPQTLAETTLAGPRGPECLRLVIAADVSGSMTEFTTARENALADLLAWAPGQLREDDELAVLSFAGDTSPIAGPVTVADPTAGSSLRTTDPLDPDGTDLAPVLDAVGALPVSGCETALVLLSDAQLDHTPGSEIEGLAALQRVRVDHLRLMVPSHGIDVDPAWVQVFPYAAPDHFDGLDRDDTALAIGRLVAGFTGQQLVRV